MVEPKRISKIMKYLCALIKKKKKKIKRKEKLDEKNCPVTDETLRWTGQGR